MIKINPFKCTDAYKVAHRLMYPDGIDFLYANMTPRSDKIFKRIAPTTYNGELVFFGLQGALTELLEMFADFFKSDKDIAVKRLGDDFNSIFNREVDVSILYKLHALGYLPITVKALKEGSRVPMGVPIFTIKSDSNDSDFYFLVEYFESLLSSLIWKQSTVATIAGEYRKLFEKYAGITGSDKGLIDYQGHDFSFRGLNFEDGIRCGAAHSIFFKGSDMMASREYLEHYYSFVDSDVCSSIFATEHSVSTANIIVNKIKLDDLISYSNYMRMDIKDAELLKEAKELIAKGWDVLLIAEMVFLRDLITKKFPTGIVGYVADSYDYYSVITKILPYLKDVILERDGKLVIRPDSGTPDIILNGYDAYMFPDIQSALKFAEENKCDELLANIPNSDFSGVLFKLLSKTGDGYDTKDVTLDEVRGTFNILWDTFGGYYTSEGYKVLNDKIGVIYGDSITMQSCEHILKRMTANNFASQNLFIGIGSFSYNYHTRDTFGFAVKSTALSINGTLYPIYKDPKTAGGTKKSHKGLIKVVKGLNHKLESIDNVSEKEEQSGMLVPVLVNGSLVRSNTYQSVRALALSNSL